MMAEDDQNIEEAEPDRRHHEQIHRGDAGGMVAQKGLPALARRSPTSPHVLRHCRLRDLDAELLKLGIEVAQSTVAKYMGRCRRPPSQSWKTFLRNHAAGIAAMDLLVVPTIGFRLLYVLVILGHHRRRILSFGVTSHPTAEWIARRITDAFPWTEAPRYLIRDRDAVYGQVVTPRLKSIGIRA